MGKKTLVLVESPAKAKSISKILGKGFDVMATMGHIIDLPQKRMGVDLENRFKPEYVVIPGRKKIISDITKRSQAADRVLVATDPDREGEAIGYLVKEYLGNKKKIKSDFSRVTFHEITKQAISKAFDSPGDFNMALFNSQQARRILDRIVGYLLSPFLWKKVGKGLSAGRVQSVALRLIVEREREIRAFVPREYWLITADFDFEGGRIFEAKLTKINGQAPDIHSQEEAEKIEREISSSDFFVCSSVEKKEKKRNAPPPFTTSTMQQAAFNALGFSADRCMRIAQQLYEGIELDSGQEGIITYMRTDSVNISPQAIGRVRQYISERLGPENLPEKPNRFKSKKGAQEAHEAIRPTDVFRTPESIKGRLTEEQFKLYQLIWRRFVASQMMPAVFDQVNVEISSKGFTFKKTFSKKIFSGYTSVYEDGKESLEEGEVVLPKTGENGRLADLKKSQHFTKPPARFNDASLVKELEEKGIGRPSTYAPTIRILVNRGYVERKGRALVPSDLGEKICEVLVKSFPDIMDYDFTAKMEQDLDRIETGEETMVNILSKFFPEFKKQLDFAYENTKKEVIETDEVCEKCGRPMVIKWGSRGKFLSCSGFPECKNAKPISLGVKCPECGGEIVVRRSKKGKRFYGCSNFPECRFTASSLSSIQKSQDA